MKKFASIVYIVLLVMVIALVGGLAFSFRSQLGDIFGVKDKIEDFTFTASAVQNKKFDDTKMGYQVLVNDDISLYSNATPTVYKVCFNNENGKKVNESLASTDGYKFTHLIALPGESCDWSMANTTNETVTVDLYYTITDGTGLKTLTVGQDLYYDKTGKVQVNSTDLCVYDRNGKQIALSGEVADGYKFLGQPYKVSFNLSANSACTMFSTNNRLAIYGINFR